MGTHEYIAPPRAPTEGRPYRGIGLAAKNLQVDPATIWTWIRDGRLKSYYRGSRNIRVRKSDVHAMADDPEFAAWLKLTNEERLEVLERRSTVEKMLRRRAAFERSWRRGKGSDLPRLDSTELVRLSRARDLWYGPGQERDTYWQLYGPFS